MGNFLKKRAVFLQVRLNSSRLRGKALLKLFGKTVVEHAMERLNIVPADYRVLVTTKDSGYALKEIADKMHWNIFYGDPFNVLKRFVDAAIYYDVDTIVRATADNPLVSSEIALDTLTLFGKSNCDLAHLTNIPYGSGVEVVKRDALVTALKNTNLPYDMEHVTPYIYAHKEKFLIASEPYKDKDSSIKDVRISIDDFEDFSKVNYLYREVKKRYNLFKIDNIIDTWKKLDFKKYKRCLLLTAFSDSFGIGHLKRLLKLANELKGEFNIFLSFKHGNKEVLKKEELGYINYIEYEKLSSFVKEEGIFDRVLVDLRDTTSDEMKLYKDFGPVVSFDDMGEGGKISDINIKALPSLKEKDSLKFNLNGLEYLLTDISVNKKDLASSKNNPAKNVLVTFGGSDIGSFSKPVARILEKLGYNVTVIVGPYFKDLITESEKCKVVKNVSNLKEYIVSSDLVITSFGITFFESLTLNRAVLLINPSMYHDRLTNDFGYPYLIENNNEDGLVFGLDLKVEEMIKRMNEESAFSSNLKENPLADFFKINVGSLKNEMVRLIKGWNYSLPLCLNCSSDKNSVIYRTPSYNMYKCDSCGLIYTIPLTQINQKYDEEYFVTEYKEHYGRTYEEDKDNIVMLARERLYQIRSYITKGKLLDFGSGLGFFAEYCENNGFITTCIDTSNYAIDYITDVLKLKAIKGDASYLEKNFDLYDVITSFFVIEHIQDFKKLIFLFALHLNKGGILCLSTPNAKGITIRKDFLKYASKHPVDHFIILSPSILIKILKEFGFKKIKVVIRGIHIDRFVSSERLRKSKLFSKALYYFASLFRLGDTFEIYAQKE